MPDGAGVSLSALGSMKEGVLGALGGDAAALSALRCLRIYLTRLGAPEADAQASWLCRPTSYTQCITARAAAPCRLCTCTAFLGRSSWLQDWHSDG